MVQTFQCSVEGLTIVTRRVLCVVKLLIHVSLTVCHLQCVTYNDFFRSHDDDDVIVLTA